MHRGISSPALVELRYFFTFSPEFNRVYFDFSQLRKEASASTTHIASSIAIWTVLLSGLS